MSKVFSRFVDILLNISFSKDLIVASSVGSWDRVLPTIRAAVRVGFHMQSMVLSLVRYRVRMKRVEAIRMKEAEKAAQEQQQIQEKAEKKKQRDKDRRTAKRQEGRSEKQAVNSETATSQKRKVRFQLKWCITLNRNSFIFPASHIATNRQRTK